MSTISLVVFITFFIARLVLRIFMWKWRVRRMKSQQQTQTKSCVLYIYIYSTNRVKSNKLCRQTRAGSSSSFFFSWILQLKSIAGLLSWTRFTNSCNCSYHRLTWASIPYELLTMIESKCMQIANITIYLSVQNGCFDRPFYFFFLRAQPQQQLPIHPKYLQIFLCRYFSILFHHSL